MRNKKLIACALSIVISILLIIDIKLSHILTPLDNLINQQTIAVWTPALSIFFAYITDLASTWVISILSLALILLFYYYKQKRKAFLITVTIASSFILTYGLKALIQRSRPENALIGAEDFAFPSGHALKAIVFFGILIYLFKDKIESKTKRYIFISFCTILISLIGASRLYFRYHYFTDIMGGYALGIAILTAAIYLIERNQSNSDFPQQSP